MIRPDLILLGLTARSSGPAAGRVRCRDEVDGAGGTAHGQRPRAVTASRAADDISIRATLRAGKGSAGGRRTTENRTLSGPSQIEWVMSQSNAKRTSSSK